MSRVKVTLDLPGDMLGALDVPQVHVETRMRELIALELFREGRISSGKAAEILGVSKSEFIQLLAQRGVAYFTESADELRSDTNAVEALMRSTRA